MAAPLRFDVYKHFYKGRLGTAHYDKVDESKVNPEFIYHGRDVRWLGQPGYMIRVPAAYVTPILENQFYPNQLARYMKAMKDGDLIEAPAGRVYVVDKSSIEGSHEQVEWGEYEYPFTEEDIGQPYVTLLDGNHRAFAALLRGEPYIWVYVGENYRDTAQPWME